MTQVILVGCDLHDDSLVLQVSVGAEAPVLKKYGNHPVARGMMLRELRLWHRACDALAA